MSSRRLLTIAEAAAELGVSKRGLRAEAERHSASSSSIGRKPLLDAAQLGELDRQMPRSIKGSPHHAEGETRATGTSGTATRGSRPGPLIEDELTRRLPATSPNRGAR